jgi:hypothetical protein
LDRLTFGPDKIFARKLLSGISSLDANFLTHISSPENICDLLKTALRQHSSSVNNLLLLFCLFLFFLGFLTKITIEGKKKEKI